MSYKLLHIDYETYSLANLKEVGLDNYAKHPSTGISILAWALDDEEIEVWLPHVGPMPQKLLDAFRNPKIIKIAWHGAFEHIITNHVTTRLVDGGLSIPISEFRDPIVLAHNLSLPGKLSSVGAILNMKEQKDPRGEELVKMFCNPVSMGGEETLFGISPPLFRDHISHPKEFAEYIEYCRQDVRSERDLWHRLCKIPFPEHEWQGWLLDQKINQFGIPVRRDLAEKGLRLALKFVDLQSKLLIEKTGLQNPAHSDPQMKGWVSERGYPWNSLRAPTVDAELKNLESKLTPECREALILRKSARRTSYTKLEKLLSILSSDDRLKYQFNYMGAARTGRWKSGGSEDTSIQVQNMSRGEKAVKKRLELALQLVEQEDYDGIVREFTNTPNPKDSVTVLDVVITILRSLFQASPGKKFIVSDKNAIENRMLGWAAGEPAILDVFWQGRCPYMAFGAVLFEIPYEDWIKVDEHGNHKPKNAEFEEKRQQAKAPVLGGGYGLGGGESYIDEYGDEKRGGMWGYALNVCGVDMPKELAHKAVKVLRAAWPNVIQFWVDLEEAFKQVFKRGGVVKVGEVTWNKQTRAWVEHPTQGKQCVIAFRRFKMQDGRYSIRMELPSGRALHYLNVTIEPKEMISQKTGNPYTVDQIFYDGIEHSATQGADGANVRKQHKWGRVKSYGGKLCLGGTTQVITPFGLKRLDEISLDDRVWDGIEWVQHGGLQCNGLRETQTWMGLTGTSDHQILGGNEWHELGRINSPIGLCSLLTGLVSAIRLWCSLNRASLAALGCDAIADKSSMWIQEPFVETTSITVPRADVKTERQTEPRCSDIISFSTENCGICGSENSPVFYPDVTIQNVPPTQIMGDGEFHATNRGEEAAVCGLNMLSLCRDGITPLLTLIESTTMGIMNREISASSLEMKIQTISELLFGLVGMERNFPMRSFASDLLRYGARTLSIIISSADAPLNGASTDTNKQKVYDLRNCGPRHRFTVLTDAGPVVVHNCENAIQAMSRDDLLNSMFLADEMGFHIIGMFHDELLCEEDDVWDGLTLEDLNWCMSTVPDWAPGFISGSEGFTDRVYHK